MSAPEIDVALAKALEAEIQSLQRLAADRQDRAALHMLDAIWSIEDRSPISYERMALFFLLKLRLHGQGEVGGKVTTRALVQLVTLTGGL